MASLTVAGWATVGFITRCYQLGIQKRNVFENFGGHAFYTAAFGAAGYYFYGLEGRQYAAIEAKKEEILRNRERMEQVRAARQEAAGAQEEH
ncbi:unnamed protein product [Jaminaea pallidilutea]